MTEPAKKAPVRLVIDGLGKPPRLMVGEYEIGGVVRVEFEDLVPRQVGTMRIDVMIDSMEVAGACHGAGSATTHHEPHED